MEKYYIGIATRYLVTNQEKVFVNQSIISYAKRNQLIPIFLDISNYQKLLSFCDLFLIPGGNDINPSYYNEKIDSSTILVKSEIDELDFSILNYAYKNKKPILGICRGIQIINVFFKGTLFQNLNKNNHNSNELCVLDICNNSLFSKIYKKEKITINSYHHQAINQLGENLIIDGYQDGVIEAIHHKELPIIGVQYHPESINDKDSDLLLNYLKKYIKRL